MVLAGLLLVALVAVPVAAGASDRGVRASPSTVWLCRPGQRPDPCAYPRAATAVTGSGSTGASTSSPTQRSAQRFDCFYVYPTVSTEQTNNANLAVQPAELAVAASQASRFSQVCRVWAPMYRQATVYALTHGAITGADVDEHRLRQSSLGLARLHPTRQRRPTDRVHRALAGGGHAHPASATEIDPSPRLRKQLVSAIILGGNVQVPTGRRVGGSFQHIPTCASASSTGCVIAYSTFGSAPPPRPFSDVPGVG